MRRSAVHGLAGSLIAHVEHAFVIAARDHRVARAVRRPPRGAPRSQLGLSRTTSSDCRLSVRLHARSPSLPLPSLPPPIFLFLLSSLPLCLVQAFVDIESHEMRDMSLRKSAHDYDDYGADSPGGDGDGDNDNGPGEGEGRGRGRDGRESRGDKDLPRL